MMGNMGDDVGHWASPNFRHRHWLAGSDRCRDHGGLGLWGGWQIVNQTRDASATVHQRDYR
jgi:hypothetical protein